MKQVFIDGAAGTTGMIIAELIEPLVRDRAISLVGIEDRKNLNQRLAAHQEADVSVLCLPDDAARDIATILQGEDTRLLDASSAHRVSDGWTYGFPELTRSQPRLIAQSQYVSNPGCYATGAISILRPLGEDRRVRDDAAITIVGASGYTGGGKKLVGLHQNGDSDFRLANIFSAYSLNQPHKHIPEIQKYGMLSEQPIFIPHVIGVKRGIIVSVAFNKASIHGDARDVHAFYESYYGYEGSKVRVAPFDPDFRRLNYESFVDLNHAHSRSAQEDVTIHVGGWDNGKARQVSVHAVLDNLGKGAGAQAVQNLKLMLGL